jgi:hypothetical protein
MATHHQPVAMLDAQAYLLASIWFSPFSELLCDCGGVVLLLLLS